MRTCTIEINKKSDNGIPAQTIAYRDLAQVVLQDLGAEILQKRSWTRKPQTETDLAEVLYRILEGLDTNTLRKTFSYTGFAQVVPQDLRKSLAKRPAYTEILHK